MMDVLGELLAGIIGLVAILLVLLYGGGLLIVLLGAIGWYLQFWLLGALTITAYGLLLWSYLSWRKDWECGLTWRRWRNEGVLFLVTLGLLIIWSVALREQLEACWNWVSQYIIR